LPVGGWDVVRGLVGQLDWPGIAERAALAALPAGAVLGVAAMLAWRCRRGPAPMQGLGLGDDKTRHDNAARLADQQLADRRDDHPTDLARELIEQAGRPYVSEPHDPQAWERS
jgi:hypothetical protein